MTRFSGYEWILWYEWSCSCASIRHGYHNKHFETCPKGLFCAQHRACTSAALLHQCFDNLSFSSWRRTDAVRWCSFLDNITEAATQSVLACMQVQYLWICADLSVHFPHMTRSSRKANRRPSSRTVYSIKALVSWVFEFCEKGWKLHVKDITVKAYEICLNLNLYSGSRCKAAEKLDQPICCVHSKCWVHLPPSVVKADVTDLSMWV